MTYGLNEWLHGWSMSITLNTAEVQTIIFCFPLWNSTHKDTFISSTRKVFIKVSVFTFIQTVLF